MINRPAGLRRVKIYVPEKGAGASRAAWERQHQYIPAWREQDQSRQERGQRSHQQDRVLTAGASLQEGTKGTEGVSCPLPHGDKCSKGVRMPSLACVEEPAS